MKLINGECIEELDKLITEGTNVLYIKTFENGKFYIGITKNFKKRMRDHDYEAYSGNSQFAVHRAMRKHKHATKILCISKVRETILKMEIALIKRFKDNGCEIYNMTSGGEGVVGNKMSEETKKRMSEARKGKKHTQAAKDKVSKFNKGKITSEETKRKIGEAQKGDKNHNTKPKGYFEKNEIPRSRFKRTCKRHGWNFNNFIETYNGKKTKCGSKKFSYKEITEVEDAE